MTVSIIIAVKTWQENLARCVRECLALKYPDFEILVMPDMPLEIKPFDQRLRFIPTGPINPAAKRDKALYLANGQILAFLDDDAYPRPDWLTNAVVNFEDPEVAAVGGPAITPTDDKFSQIASGLIFSSVLVSGNFIYRYIPGKKRQVDDYPSCNFIVRKTILLELGGFNTNFWPGEDTKLCLDITKKLNKKIVYDPKVLVYHHRRTIFSSHLKQIASYALHRGYFVKRFPATSFKLPYFIPSFLLIFTIIGIASLSFNLSLFLVFLSLFSIYLIIILISCIFRWLEVKTYYNNVRLKASLITCVFIGIILTHFVYGFCFLKGLFSKSLKEEG